MNHDIKSRRDTAVDIVDAAAVTALNFFRQLDDLEISEKGVQDLVSNADLAVERQIRDQLSAAFPDDGIVGEEHGTEASDSAYTWVIDPIDGTANFVRGIPGWCVVVACVTEDQSVIGVIRDPVADESWIAVRGEGTTLNGKAMRVAASSSLTEGSLGVGYSNRVPAQLTINALTEVINAGSVFYRNASGALMLAYVASGRLLGYIEPHMNAWDCVAALLMIEEAGGKVLEYEMAGMLENGGQVVTSTPAVYEQLRDICRNAYVGSPYYQS